MLSDDKLITSVMLQSKLLLMKTDTPPPDILCASRVGRYITWNILIISLGKPCFRKYDHAWYSVELVNIR